jgi:hypothetical protein
MSSLRLPQSFTRPLNGESADAALRHEMVEEQVGAGLMGRKAEAALAALRAHVGYGRVKMRKAATDAVWWLLVQREAPGLRDRAAIVAQYDIPREVLVRLVAR